MGVLMALPRREPGWAASLLLALPNQLAEDWEEVEQRHHQRWCESNGL